LYGGDHDFGALPVFTILFIYDGLIIAAEVADEVLVGLIFKCDAINEEEDAMSVTGAQEELDDGSSDKSFAGTGRHFEEIASIAIASRFLQSMDGPQLVLAQQAQTSILDECGALGFVEPAGISLINGILGNSDVIGGDHFPDQALGIWFEGLTVCDGGGSGELGNDLWIATFKIPEVMQVAVGEDDKADVFGFGVGAGLLFADKGI